jgi:hypothetical protein
MEIQNVYYLAKMPMIDETKRPATKPPDNRVTVSDVDLSRIWQGGRVQKATGAR